MSRPARPLFSNSPIENHNRVLLLAYDQGMEHGPTEFNDQNVDPGHILAIADKGPFTGIVLQKGVARAYYQADHHKVPLVLKLNGKTNLVKDQDPYAPQVCTVEEAVQLGAKAVGYTVYLGSQFEQQMFKEFAQIAREAHQQKIPVIAWMYARGHNISSETHRDIVAYAARVALELGADYVNVHDTGQTSDNAWVVESAGKCRVLLSGASLDSSEGVETLAQSAIEAGAAGITIGRKVWQASDPQAVARTLGEIIFGSVHG